MIRDIALLLSLKKKHAGTMLSRLVFFATGSHVQSERSAGDTLYRIYALMIWLICFSMLWLALLDSVETLFSSFTLSFALGLVPMVFAVPLGYLAVMVFGNLVETPFRFTNADISYVAAGPFSSFSIVFTQMIASVIGNGILGFVVGYLLGTGFAGIALFPFSPFAPGITMMNAFVCITMIFWLTSVFQWSGDTSYTRRKGVTITLCVMFLIGGLLAIIFSLPGMNDFAILISVTSLPVNVVLLAVTVLVLVILLLRSRKLDLAALAVESGLYAELYSLREMPLFDALGYQELRRKKKLARKGVKAFLPIGSGIHAPLTRSLLSHLRQPFSLLAVAGWGALAAPIGTYILLGAGELLLWLAWVYILLLFTRGLREITRPFRDDSRNQTYRSQLPFRDLPLFTLDSLPGFLTAILISIIVVVALLPHMAVQAILLCVALNLVFVFSSGFENAGMPYARHRVSYEAIIIFFIILLFIISLFGITWLTGGVAIGFGVVLIVFFHFMDA